MVENPFTNIEFRLVQIEELVRHLSEKLLENTCTNEYERLTRKTVSKEYQLSLGTLHNAMRDGRLAYEKVGRKTLFKRVEVEKFVNKKGLHHA